MASTTTANNLSTSRTVQFTVAGVVSLAWKKAQMINIRQEPDASEQEFARQHLLMIMDEIAKEAKIARSVTRYTVATVADQAAYTLDASILDVVDIATYTPLDSDYDLQIMPIGRDAYMRHGDKLASGTPVEYFVEKSSVLTLNLWPVPTETDATVTIQAVRWLYDTTTSAQTVDLERYFAGYLVSALAYEIAMANSKPIEFCRTLKKEAAEKLVQCLGTSKERGDFQLHIGHRTPWS